jgi:hypothetical protein
MNQFVFVCLILFSTQHIAQKPCDFQLKSDSANILTIINKEAVELINVNVRNNYQIQFIKQDLKNYLKIIVKDDLGIGKKGSLLILCAKNQIYIKTITLTRIDKTSAFFIIDLNNNYYLDNIKQFGISKIIFNELAEFSLPKHDSDQIKNAALCFFNIVKDNIRLPLK